VRFDALVARDNGRAFLVATLIWGCGLVAMSGAHVVLALRLPHDEFMLISPILGAAADFVLLGWSMRYIWRRLSPLIAQRSDVAWISARHQPP
jgi:hypothetical protein